MVLVSGYFPTGGADYKFGKIPLDVSVDIRPTFRVASPTYYNYENFISRILGFLPGTRIKLRQLHGILNRCHVRAYESCQL